MKGSYSVLIRTPMGTVERPLPDARTMAGARVAAVVAIENWRDQNPKVRVWDAKIRYEGEVPVRARPGDCENCDDPACRGCHATRS